MIGAIVFLVFGLPLFGFAYLSYREGHAPKQRAAEPEGDFNDLPPDQMIAFTEGFISSEILDDLDDMFD